MCKGIKIGIFGAGPGAFAMACRVVGAGHLVGICELEQFASNIKGIQQSGAIFSTGMMSGRFPLAMAVTDAKVLLKWADMVLVATHVGAHPAIASLCADYCRDEVPIILCPAYVAGAQRFQKVLLSRNPDARIRVAECSVLPFACRKPQADQVSVHGMKRKLFVSWPGKSPVPAVIHELFDEVVIVDHPLAAGLNETNFIIHSCICLSNMEKVISGKPWRFYRDGVTSDAGKLIDKVDAERMALLDQMGVEAISLHAWLQAFYQDQGMRGDSVAEQLISFGPFEDSPGPVSMDHRYFDEDIPYGLAAMSGLARNQGMVLAVTDSLLDTAASFLGRDFSLA